MGRRKRSNSAPAGDAIGDLSSVGVRAGDMDSFTPTDVDAENDLGDDADAPDRYTRYRCRRHTR